MRTSRIVVAASTLVALTGYGFAAPQAMAASRNAKRVSSTTARSPKIPSVVGYTIAVDPITGIDAREVERVVAAALRDHRSWGPIKRTRFVPAERGRARLQIHVLLPEDVDAACAPLPTEGERSCTVGWNVYLNALRWRVGAAASRMPIDTYRFYLVNHEVGHALGEHHLPCAGPGRLAPVMLQQTKGLDGCRPNPWPNPAAVLKVSPTTTTVAPSPTSSSPNASTTTPAAQTPTTTKPASTNPVVTNATTPSATGAVNAPDSSPVPNTPEATAAPPR